jgi:NAD(P)-dependent dehydrogenase (short-subunit alcohol dehydrogenase family)
VRVVWYVRATAHKGRSMSGASNPMAFVTGAAGSIGQATIEALSSRGWPVVTADRTRLPDSHAQFVLDQLELDLQDDPALTDAVTTLRSLGRLEHVIAIAGGGDAEELSQADPVTEDPQIFARVVVNNLFTAFATIRHVVPILREGDGNRSITLVGSINAFGGYGAPGYSAAKAGLIGLTNALTGPLGADGIRINCLALGTVDTEQLRRLRAARGLEGNLGDIADRAPLKRVLTPTDVAQALVAMALDMPGLTGATLVLDNGQTRIR